MNTSKDEMESIRDVAELLQITVGEAIARCEDGKRINVI